MAFDKARVEKLWQKAEAIRQQHLRTNIRYDSALLPPPFIVEQSGMPSIGKTAIVESSDMFLRKFAFRVRVLQEGAQNIRYIPRSTPDYNIRTGIYTLAAVLDEFYMHLHDLVLLDRGLFDTYMWMEYWYRKGKLSKKERDGMQAFFLRHAEKIDLAYLMIADPQIASERSSQKALTLQPGESTSIDSLKLLHEICLESYEALSRRHPQLRLIDTGPMDLVEMKENIFEQTLTAFHEKIPKNGGK